MTNGKFIISLDFELMWGVRDKRTMESYGANIKGVHQVIPQLLRTFSNHQVKATFSTVGFLFFETKKDLVKSLPAEKPGYKNSNLSPYNGHFEMVGEDYLHDKFHFGYELINEIKKYPEQEIGTHTFSHFYCLEPGQTIDEFRADLKCAIAAAQMHNIQLSSLVFPRNQFNDAYLKVIEEAGIICYRGNEVSWLYEAKMGEEESLFRRALRLADAYINISGHNCYDDASLKNKFPVNLPSSRFLRPYSHKVKFLDALRLKRIKSGMTYAAKNNLMYHLWWHPHNFGINQEENFSFLEKILQHYGVLNDQYGFKSYTMTELASLLMQAN